MASSEEPRSFEERQHIAYAEALYASAIEAVREIQRTQAAAGRYDGEIDGNISREIAETFEEMNPGVDTIDYIRNFIQNRIKETLDSAKLTK